MGNSNRKAKEALIKLYGAECFIEKLHLRVDTEPRKYTGKGQMKRMKELTYHHIKEKSKGGKATVQNGALLSAENHQWFNKQSKDKQEEMNEKFQDYKKRADTKGYKIATVEFTTEGIKQTEMVEISPVQDDYIEIPLEDNTIDQEAYKNYLIRRRQRVWKKFNEEYQVGEEK